MSVDLIKKFAIDIKYDIENNFIDNYEISGSGVLFKTQHNSTISYILTAKHLFFPKDVYSDENYFKKFTNDRIALKPENITIIQNSKDKLPIVNYGNYAYFPKNSEADITIIPIELEARNSPDTLKIFDFESNEYKNITFFVAGYPQKAKERSNPIKLRSYELEHLSFAEEQFTKEDSGIAKLRSKVTLDFGNTDKVRDLLMGISGSGAFFCDSQKTISLGYIVSGVDDTNTLLCTRIDIFIDDLNLLFESLENQNTFPQIETNTEVFSEDEYLKFEEFSDLSFLENAIKSNATYASRELFDSPLVDYNDDFNKEIKKLHDKNKKLRDLSNSLSYLYAYAAILAHKNNKKHASAILFKKAIELNPKHQQAFVLKKARKDNNTERMQLASEKIEDIKETCKIKIENESNYHTKREIIKNAIFQISKADEDTSAKETEIKDLLSYLEKNYEADITLKDTYKYYELGQYCYSITDKPINNLENPEKIIDKYNAFFYLTISNFLLEASHLIEDDFDLQCSVNDLLGDINGRVENQDTIEQKASKKAKEILDAKQNKTTKQTLSEIKEILLSIGCDTLQLKRNNVDEKLSILTIKKRTAKIYENIISQGEQNKLHHLDIDQTNKNTTIINKVSEQLKEKLEEIPEKYQIMLDTDTKKEIRDAIDSQLTEPVSELGNIKNVTDKIHEYVTNAEKHLNTILHEEKTNLDEKNTQLSFIIEKLEKSQISFDEIKTNTISHLRSSERRMIARLNQLNINERTQYRATQVIQESISQLQKNVKAIKTEIPFKDRYEKNHSVTLEIKEIITTCQNLESRILAKLDDTLAYHADIDFIKRSQTRFEHALLPKVADALDTRKNYKTNAFNNYEAFYGQDAITQPSFSSRRKILLIVCLIILFSSMGYFFLKLSNYSLLDLLTNLWHTAWQKFNG